MSNKTNTPDMRIHAASILSMNSEAYNVADNPEDAVYEALMDADCPYKAFDALTDSIRVQMRVNGIKSIANTSAGFAVERLLDTFLETAPEEVCNAFFDNDLTLAQTMELWAKIED